MKISYGQILQAGPVLNKLVDTPLYPELALQIGDLIEALNPHLIAIDQHKQTLIDDITADMDIQDQNSEYTKRFVEYLNKTMADLNIRPISTDFIGGDLKLTVRDAVVLRFALARTNKIAEKPTTLYG